MYLRVFSIYDQATKAFAQPFFMNTTAEAIRAVTSLAKEQGHNFQVHPNDFVLYEIGEYDNLSAIINTNDGVNRIGSINELVPQQEHQETLSAAVEMAEKLVDNVVEIS